jgi:hypothetical protein
LIAEAKVQEKNQENTPIGTTGVDSSTLFNDRTPIVLSNTDPSATNELFAHASYRARSRFDQRQRDLAVFYPPP